MFSRPLRGMILTRITIMRYYIQVLSRSRRPQKALDRFSSRGSFRGRRATAGQVLADRPAAARDQRRDGLTFDPTTGYSGAADVQITTEHAANLEGHYSFDDPATLITLGNNDAPDGGPDATVIAGTGISRGKTIVK